jgi:hypothetical protein
VEKPVPVAIRLTRESALETVQVFNAVIIAVIALGISDWRILPTAGLAVECI